MSVRRGSGAAVLDILEGLNQAAAPTFAELLEQLWALKFRGSVTLHFAGGLPRAVVLCQETQFALDTPHPQNPLTAVVDPRVD